MLTYILISALFILTVNSSVSTIPELNILPSGNQSVRSGKNLVLTCRAQVMSLDLVANLKWYNPKGKEIPQDERIYSEEQPGDAATALFIKQVTLEDQGVYRCRATYASNQELETEVLISVYVGITWEDAPVAQYASQGEDYKVKCRVTANPPASIDWLKESHIITSGDQYVIEGDGLLIQQVERRHAGTYTCRARVQQTGELEERAIQLDVMEPPNWLQQPLSVVGVEYAKVEMKCSASGSPLPYYTWVDWKGNDVTMKEGWRVDPNTGTLTAYELYRQDAGLYTCTAENNAGRISSSAELTILIRPRVQELYNKTFPVGTERAELSCKVSGDPMPNVIWRKWSNNEPYYPGGQPDDPRIVVTERIVEAPDYTEGERVWKESTLAISGLERKDDGLYECQAENKAGQYFKSGHITVEFPPTFEDQVINKEWSWDMRPVNLSCIATAIPNATISWWHLNREIGREDLDPNYQILGRGPVSHLRVNPVSTKFYRHYECRAHNMYGEAKYEIELREARVPGMMSQAFLEKSTATSFHLRLIAPTDTGGIAIDSYAVEYKETREQWDRAKQKVWPARPDNTLYILEGLEPRTVYDMRFSSKNRVGFSLWGAGSQHTTPNRGRPEPPLLNKVREEGEVWKDGVLYITTHNSYLVTWKMPNDNGLPIDYYVIQYSLVRRDEAGGDWSQIGETRTQEVRNRGTVTWTVQLDYQKSFYRIEIQAHNEMGFSDSDSLVIRTAQGVEGEEGTAGGGEGVGGGGGAEVPAASSLALGPIIGGTLAVVIVILILIDISCCRLNYTGVTYLITKRCKICRSLKSRKSNGKARRMKGQKIINSAHTNSGGPDGEKLLRAGKKQSLVSYTANGRGNKTSLTHSDDFQFDLA